MVIPVCYILPISSTHPRAAIGNERRMEEVMERKTFRSAVVACRKAHTKKDRIKAIATALKITQKYAGTIEHHIPCRFAPAAKTAEHIRIEAKLQQIANALPTTGHSMGSTQYVRMGTKYLASCDRTADYAKSCTWKPTHGVMSLTIMPSEYRSIEIIGGMVTVITGPTRSRRIKKCRYIVRVGEKNHARLEWIDGFLTGDYHGTYDQCMKRLTDHTSVKTMKRTAARRDSLAVGNCTVGTDAFIKRHGLDPAKRYSKKFLYEIAEPFELRYVKRIFGEA